MAPRLDCHRHTPVHLAIARWTGVGALAGALTLGLCVAALSGCAGLAAGPELGQRNHEQPGSAQGWQAPGALIFEAFATAPVLLMGEQHNAPEHHQVQTAFVTWLSAQDRLAALVLEMAEQGHSTQGLPVTAAEAQVQAALAWQDSAWPWGDYRGAIMAAVRAGVPVVGANLSRSAMRQAMGQASLEAALPSSALQTQDERMRRGHCGMLPESQIRPMTRVQIARDQAMAATLQAHLPTDGVSGASMGPPRSVLLLAGYGHVDLAVGVPLHIPAHAQGLRVVRLQAGEAPGVTPDEAQDPVGTFRADMVWLTPALPPSDPCAAFAQPR